MSTPCSLARTPGPPREADPGPPATIERLLAQGAHPGELAAARPEAPAAADDD